MTRAPAEVGIAAPAQLPPRPDNAIVEIDSTESPADVVARLRAAGVTGVTVARWGRRAFVVAASSSSRAHAEPSMASICSPRCSSVDADPPSRAVPLWRRAFSFLTTTPREF